MQDLRHATAGVRARSLGLPIPVLNCALKPSPEAALTYPRPREADMLRRIYIQSARNYGIKRKGRDGRGFWKRRPRGRGRSDRSETAPGRGAEARVAAGWAGASGRGRGGASGRFAAGGFLGFRGGMGPRGADYWWAVGCGGRVGDASRSCGFSSPWGGVQGVCLKGNMRGMIGRARTVVGRRV